MKKYTFLLLLSTPFLMSSCSVVEGIFKLGFWSGLLLVAFVLIIVIVYKLLK